jgi:hypothetical protein
MEKVGSGIQDKHPGSATLLYSGVVVRDLHESALIWLEFGSGSVLGMRIRIQEHGNLPKFTNIPGFVPFKKVLYI